MKNKKKATLTRRAARNIAALVGLIGSPERADLATMMILDHLKPHDEDYLQQKPHGIAGELILEVAREVIYGLAEDNELCEGDLPPDILRPLQLSLVPFVRVAISPTATAIARFVIERCFYVPSTGIVFDEKAMHLDMGEEYIAMLDSVQNMRDLMYAIELMIGQKAKVRKEVAE